MQIGKIMEEVIEKKSKTLEPIAINEILDKQFFIPHYQRGYRWTNQQVQQLLDDIDSFSPREISGKPDEKTFYCLQPVVVKKMSQEKVKDNDLQGDWYELIDGQQRITTIFLILQYINDMWVGRKKQAQFTIEFETRDNCVEFLQGIKINEDEKTVDINKDNIDFFHISSAYQTIRNWEINYQKVHGKPFNESEFQSKFLAYSKIIWYEVSPNEKGQTLFERLNLGKIPLTNAELTKALFLSSESFKEIPEEERRIRQFEIARLWDEIEHRLNESDAKFWSFITNEKGEEYETKIDLLLDLISGKTKDEKDPLYTFLNFTKKQNEGGLADLWQQIEHFYYTLLQWFQESNYYHKIGYLVTARKFGQFNGIDLGQLVKDSMSIEKSEFIKQVDEIIRDSVQVELSELRYENHYNQIFNVLLLFNVETNRISDTIAENYPFKQHKSNRWSLEHIHARNSENFDKTKKEPWRKWLDIHRDLLIELKQGSLKDRDEEISELIVEIEHNNNELLNWERFSSLFKKTNDFFTQDAENMDRESEGISNLALLSQPDNAALNNSVFEAKRREIIHLDKLGSFIPICTRRIFMKYYNHSEELSQFYFWSQDDRNAYLEEIKEMLSPYLPENHIEPEIEADENE